MVDGYHDDDDEVRAAALAGHDAGLCTIRARVDGTKAPMVVPHHGQRDPATGKRKAGWEAYQGERPSRDTVAGWFLGHPGLGIVCGAVSGQLEMLELEGRAIAEDMLAELTRRVDDARLTPVLRRIAAGYTERTPSGGLHWLFRVSDGPALGSLTLAQRLATAEERADKPDGSPLRVLIETKAEGGFVIVAPSNGTTHPTGRPWTLERGGFDMIATVTTAERDELYEVCRRLDRLERSTEGIAKVPPAGRAQHKPYDGGPVGEKWMDAVEAHLAATDTMAEALVRYGWRDLGRVDSEGCPLYERPGQADAGRNGAVINTSGRLAVFSTSTPFESVLVRTPGRTYNLLDVYAAYEHEGDRVAAARAIAEETGIYERDPLAGLMPNASSSPLGRSGEEPPADAGGRSCAPARNLPDEFWQRPALAAVRDAAKLIDVSAESLTLAACAAVAAHIPEAVRLPGPRLGTVDLLVCVVGPPGDGKGAVLDRSHQLIPLPADATLDRLGTSQGLVKRGYKPNPDPDAAARRLKPLVRRNGAIVVRCDEISTFAARTKNGTPAGEDLLGTLKSAVSGEGLGGGYAGADKNLPLEPGAYRVVGVIGIAPDKAEPLFGDLGGGFPERLLFAYVAGDDDGGDVDEQTALDAAQPFTPIVWPHPAPLSRQSFDTDRAILTEMHNRRRARRRVKRPAPYAAHHDLLRHKLAAVLAYFDGRWAIGSDDWRLAGMLMDVSVAARERLLADIEAEKQRGEDHRNDRIAATEVTKDRAVRADQAKDRTRVIDRARDLVAKVAEEPDISPADLRKTIRSTSRHEFDPAFGHAVEMGWLVVTEVPGQGESRRAVSLGFAKP